MTTRHRAADPGLHVPARSQRETHSRSHAGRPDCEGAQGLRGRHEKNPQTVATLLEPGHESRADLGLDQLP